MAARDGGSVGRGESPLDPGAGPVQQFAFELRKLRQEAGRVTYRDMAQKSAYSVTSLSRAAAGERLPSLPLTLAYVRACDGDAGVWEQRWHEAAQASVARERQVADADSPYQGLVRFEPADHGRFFGRDDLIAAVRRLADEHRFVSVFGASGSGKSSLLRAGLIPALRGRHGTVTAIRILSPGPHPLRTHAEVLRPDTSAAGDTVVIVDQFEEVFTLCRDRGERAGFIDRLLTALRPDSRLRVIIAVRADFYGRCAEYRLLTDAVREAQLLVGPMNPAEMREVVVGPARAAGLIVERPLTARLIREVEHQPGALPLLSHVLRETWLRRRGRVLTIEAYEAAGALRGAISQTAEDVYTRLSPAQAALARLVLLRLVTPGEGAQDTRRPADRAELGFADPQEVDLVLERLAHARLVTLDNGSVSLAHDVLLSAWPRLNRWVEEDRALLRAHRRFREAALTWKELARDTGTLYSGARLTQAEETFPALGLTPLERSFLAAGVTARAHEQRVASATRRRTRALLTSFSVAVVLALVAGGIAWEQNRTRSRERVRTDARRIAALADSLRASDPMTAMRLSVASVHLADLPETRSALLGAMTQKEQDVFADPDTDPSTTRYLSGDGRTLISAGAESTVSWDLRTHRRTGTYEGLGTELSRVSAMSPRADMLTLIWNGQVRLWSLRSARQEGPPIPGGGSEFGPSGRTFVVYGTDGADELIQLRDVESRQVLLERRIPGSSRSDPAPDSAVVPVSNWNMLRYMRQRPEAVNYPFPDAVVSADDRLVALCLPGKQLEIWDVPRHRKLSTPWAPRATGANCLEQQFRFTPDGRRLSLVDGTGVRQWTIATGKELPKIEHSGLREVEFSTDSGFLAASSADEILVWRVADTAVPVLRNPLPNESAGELRFDLRESQIRYFAGPNGNVTRSLSLAGVLDDRWQEQRAVSAAFSPTSRQFATAYWDAKARRFRFWLRDQLAVGAPVDLPSVPCPGQAGTWPRTGCGDPLMAFSPDGWTLAYGITDHAPSSPPVRVALWNIGRRSTAGSLDLTSGGDRQSTDSSGQGSPLLAIGFSPDGRSLLAGRRPERGPHLDIWDLEGRSRTREIENVEGDIMATRPDGRLLVTSHGQLVTLPSGAVRYRSLATSEPTALAFSPDGRYFAAGDGSGQVTLWDGAVGRLLGTLSPALTGARGNAGTNVSALAFSHDGRTLAVGSEDGTLRLWDTDSHKALGSLPTPGGAMLALAFSPEDGSLSAAGTHVPLLTYRIGPEEVTAAVCRRTRTGLSPSEWRTYLPGLPHRAVCDG
ncbi:hypothetical protein ACFXKG_38600 [Streptomyces sp. NPDC059255]|uniref:nSTAND1 domain-containing NTPase n=1 Tax=Streptomyces sp. NPDC059255 TaxID=3346793 RepID=UPI003693388A